MKIILASASPRRTQILTMLGYRFETVPSHFDEDSVKEKDPEKLVRALARHKALEVSQNNPEHITLGFDSVVYWNGEILGKPNSREEARKYLNCLSGCIHEVMTGVAVTHSGKLLAEGAACTRVQFRKIKISEIDSYIDTGSPMDKAGAYGIQDQGARFVESIQGCFYNVMGLPVVLTETLLQEAMEIINGRS